MKVALCGTPSTEEGWRQVWELIGQLREREITVYGSPDLAWAFAERQRDAVLPLSVGALHPMPARPLPLAADLLVVWGGTDILLRRLRPISRHGPTVLLVGDSKVFPAVAEASLKKGVERVLNGEGVLDARMLLRARLFDTCGGPDQKEQSDESRRPRTSKDPKTEVHFVGAGEIVFHRNETDTLLTIDLTVNGRRLTRQEADGLIISTPTGSIGRSLSAGGPFVAPGTEGLLVTPLASHTLTTRPILVPRTSEIEVAVQSQSGEAYLRVDRSTRPLENGRVVTIRPETHALRLVDFASQNIGALKEDSGEASARKLESGEPVVEMEKLPSVSTEDRLRRHFPFPRQQTCRDAFSSGSGSSQDDP